MFKVYSTACKNCLLSPDSIVSPKRRNEIINKCVKDQTYFICHKDQTGNDNEVDRHGICCKTFYDKLGHVSNLIRIAQRLGAIQEVEHSSNEKLSTFKEMNSNKKSPSKL